MIEYLDDERDREFIINEAMKLANDLLKVISQNDTFEFHSQIGLISLSMAVSRCIQAGILPESQISFVDIFSDSIKKYLQTKHESQDHKHDTGLPPLSHST